MENLFEREVKRLAFVEERMKIREQEKKQLDAEENKRQQVGLAFHKTWSQILQFIGFFFYQRRKNEVE